MLSKGAMSHVKTVSTENFDVAPGAVPDTVVDQGDVANTVVSPTDSPSSVIPVPVSAEPTPETQPVDIQQVIETQNPTEMLGQAAQEATVLQARADELLDMQHACEQYAKLIRQTGLEGISQEGAAFLTVGLEVIQKSLGTQYKVSNEDFSTINPRSSRVKATISVEDIKEMANTAYEKLKEIIRKIIALIEKGWEKFQDFGMNQNEKIEELMGRIKAVKGSGALSKEITIRSPGMLYADGELVYPEVRQLTGLAHFALRAYPKALTDYYKGLDAWIKKMGDLDVTEEEIEAHMVHVAKPLAALTNDPTVGQLFNGNRKVDISPSELSFGITQGEGAEAPPEVELPVAPLVKLRKALVDIKIINDIIISYRDANKKIVDAANKLQADNTNKAATEVLAKVVKDSAPRNREIAEFITQVLRAYVSVIEQMVVVHEGAGKA